MTANKQLLEENQTEGPVTGMSENSWEEAIIKLDLVGGNEF